MRIDQLNPTVTPWHMGRGHKASTWSSVDIIRYYGANCPPDTIREVWHYSTLMGEFVLNNYEEFDTWAFFPLSVGHGSVSDQKAMNALLSQANSPVRFRRNGGVARYENKDNHLTIAVRTRAI